jgi:putative FmdB family regulatory protein
MPIYEYRCRGCAGDFEKYVPTAATAVACPRCESGDVMRKLSVFGMKTQGAVASMPSSMPSGGSCCGGGCSCH